MAQFDVILKTHRTGFPVAQKSNHLNLSLQILYQN